MKHITLISLLLITVGLFGQEKNKLVDDEKLNKEVLIGLCDRDGLQSEVFREFYNREYDAYTPDEGIVEKIKKLKKGLELVIVMGSWCHDSKEQVPRFYKILDESGIKDAKTTLIAVDRNKTGGDFDISSLNIERVPTFIFYKKGREIGRIVETPTSFLEKDMLFILTMGS